MQVHSENLSRVDHMIGELFTNGYSSYAALLSKHFALDEDQIIGASALIKSHLSMQNDTSL